MSEAIFSCINTFECPKINQYWTGLFVSYSVQTQLHKSIFFNFKSMAQNLIWNILIIVAAAFNLSKYSEKEVVVYEEK